MKRSFKRLGIAVALVLGHTATTFAAQTLVRRIPLQVSDHQSVQATVKIPSGLRRGERVPAFLVFGGFESAAHVLDLIHPHTPVALASFDYPFSGSRELRLRDGLAILREAQVVQPETVNGILALVGALKRNPRIDPHRIILIGASFGAPFALAAAARDPDISGVALVDAFGKVRETAEHVILRSWLPKYGWPSRPVAWLISRIAWSYLKVEPPEADARRLGPGQRVLMITAENDSFIPRSASDSLWSAIEESRAQRVRVLMPGDHLMPGAHRLINQIIHEVEKWEKTRPPYSRHKERSS